MSLEEMRNNIDAIDSRILGLLAERMKESRRIGALKKRTRTPVADSGREQQVLEHVKGLAAEQGLNAEDVERLYRLIIASSRSVQGIEAAFQGQAGAYSQEAAFSFFGSGAQTRPCETLDEVFSLVQGGLVPHGVVPVENSQEGSINRSYDLLLDSDVMVCGEVMVRISHCLIANAATTPSAITKIYSHPQALAQCQGYLRRLNCELVPTYDTAGSVKLIKEKRIMDGAAVASARAAQIYGMKVIARGIEDNPRNTTRFFVLGRHDCPVTGSDKTSIVFLLKHRPGTLHEALGEFSSRGINLTRIESRPTRQKPWEYNFYLDFEGHRGDPAIREALFRLEELSLFLKVLGSYPRASTL